MGALIDRDFQFQAGVHFQDMFIMNLYEFTVSMEVNTESIREQNIALERMKYFLFECLENAIFVSETEKKVIEKYMAAGIKVCVIPEEPYDQIIALMLMMKFDTIAENRIKVTDIVFTSKLSDDVRFKEDIETAFDTFGTTGWWGDPSPAITTVTGKSQNKKDKILTLVNKHAWNDSGLTWKEKTVSTEIIFASSDTEK